MIRTNDGQTLVSTHPADVVNELNNMSFSPEKTPRRFMVESAGRILTFLGAKIRTDSAEHYVDDLFQFGLLNSDEDPEPKDIK